MQNRQDQQDQISFDSFIRAARAGDVPTIERYIAQHRERGDLVAVINNAAGQYAYTALICAADNGRAAAVLVLLAVPGINVNVANLFGHTALICAAANGDTAAVLALLAVPGINVNAADQSGNTALIWAAVNGRTDVVCALLAVPGINLDAQNSEHRTAAAEAERRINNNPVYKKIYDFIMTSIRVRRALGAAAAASSSVTSAVTAAASSAVVNESNSKDAATPDLAKLRAARLKVFGGTLPASNPTLSLAAQTTGENSQMAIDPRP